MARTKIHAHFVNKDEEDTAAKLMSVQQRTQAYLAGEIEEEEIPQLKEKGLVVEEFREQPIIQNTPGRQAWRRLQMKRKRRGEKEAPFLLQPLPPILEPEFCLITLDGPLFENWRRTLAELKVRLLEYVPIYSYTAKLTPDQFHKVKDLPYVKDVRMYTIEDTGPILYREKAEVERKFGKVATMMITYDIKLHLPEDKNKVIAWLNDRHINVVGSSKRKIRISLQENSPLVREILDLSEVSMMEEFIAPKLYNDIARVILGIDNSPGANPSNLEQAGDGQIVGVADTGLDKDHPDFQNRIIDIVALGRPGDPSDPDGHGTHVAGSVLGDGTASGSRIKGSAPSATLFFQSLLDDRGGLRLPIDLADLFEEAYDAGVRIHNNSWGADTESMYTFSSLEVDEFVVNRKDMLIVIAAGNEGDASNPFNTAPGFVDWLSIGSPATSKNALTVGACRNSRTQGGNSMLTYGEAWPGKFPQPPISVENVSGDPNSLAAFSSRGPSDDQRIKPDLVAPGTDIVSTRSSIAPARNFWGAYPGNKYAYMGGTSMATPLVAGCAALVREYYLKKRNHYPSAALLKATLINGTKWLSGQSSVADHDKMPNFHQGFGCIYMPWTIPNRTNQNLKLEFLDTMDLPNMQFTEVGQAIRYKIGCGGGEFLRMCLTWMDAQGRGLQNNLNLMVHKASSPQSKWIGNQDRPRKIQPNDPDNNIEVIRIENPDSGDYVIQLEARNLLKPPQDFALVVTGNVTTA